MSTNEGNRKVSLADYFAYCDSIEGKAEFFDGEIFDMAGGTRNHTRIGTNFIVAAGKRLEGSNCEIAGPDLRIELAAGSKYAYPDASITCGEELFSLDNQQTLRNPLVIIEVLSPSTSDFDRGGKRNHYMAMPSVQEYLLIEQSEPKVEIFIRQSETDWMFRQISGLDATLELSSISVPVSIPLAEIYQRVKFTE
jgi:Uma2 family endonuclease